jgi:hypothetical protein
VASPHYADSRGKTDFSEHFQVRSTEKEEEKGTKEKKIKCRCTKS